MIHKTSETDAATVETKKGSTQHCYLSIFVLTDAACHTLIGDTLMPPTNP